MSEIFHHAFATSRFGANGKIESISLRKTVSCVLGRVLSKKMQKSNWSNRPLHKAQIEYAALDSQVLLTMLDCLISKGLFPADSQHWGLATIAKTVKTDKHPCNAIESSSAALASFPAVISAMSEPQVNDTF